MANALQTRNSALAVLKEVTEGTPVAPSASSDYVALQDDFTMSPDFDILENAELRASIGVSKPILGAENPTASFSHYLRSSGVEGTAPNYGLLLESALGGVRTLGARDSVDSSTTAATTLTVGSGADWARGDAAIILDSTNGFSIRNVADVTGDVLTWDFELEAAPANGVELSRFVTYYPTQVDQPTLTLWHYVANQGAIQMMSGVRPTSAAMTIDAGELINVNYSFEGQEYFFDPIEITSTTDTLDFTDDDGTFQVAIANKYYKDPNDVAQALQDAMNASGTTETHSVVYNNRGADQGKFTISSSTSAVLSLLWNTGAGAANTIAGKIGFDNAADDTGATTYTSDNIQDWSTPQSASFDDADPLAAKANELFIGTADQNFCIPASSVTMNIDLTRVNVESICTDSGRDGSVISERSVPITVTAILEKDDADKFHKFHENQEVAFAYHYGEKSGGNWVVGKSGSLYTPTATINSFEVADADGLVVVNLGLQAFVNSDGEDEVFANFL